MVGKRTDGDAGSGAERTSGGMFGYRGDGGDGGGDRGCGVSGGECGGFGLGPRQYPARRTTTPSDGDLSTRHIPTARSLVQKHLKDWFSLTLFLGCCPSSCIQGLYVDANSWQNTLAMAANV